MNKTILKLLEVYQGSVSHTLNSKCRHTPTCSNYAIIAYENHNFFRASFLTSKRLLSCNPLFRPSFDPVPLRRRGK